MKKLFLLAVLAFSLTGCTSTNITKLVGALSKDPATVSVSVQSVYGTMKFVRTNPEPGQAVVVTPDGTVTIKNPEKE